jgi:hypothetical protein
MVCDDCKPKLSVISAPDPWAAGSTGAGANRRVNENKLLRKGIRSNPCARTHMPGSLLLCHITQCCCGQVW